MDLSLTDEEQAFQDEARAVDRGQQPRSGSARRPRALQVRARVAGQDARGRLGRRLVAEGVRRPRRDADRAGAVLRGDRARQGAAARERARARHGRAGRDRARHRGAEGALPRADPVGRGDLVPGLLRARVGLRPRVAQDQGGEGERRLEDQRPEGLDDVRARGQVVHARRALGLRRPQAQGPHLLHLRHGPGGGRREAAAPDHGRGRVQRDLLRGRLHPRREPDRRRGQRLERRDHDADERARRARRGLGGRNPARPRGARRADQRARARRRPGAPPAHRRDQDGLRGAAARRDARPHRRR